MPIRLVCCISLPPATILSAPVFDFACDNEELLEVETEQYFDCCGKSICGGCVQTFSKIGNVDNCPYCKAEKIGKTDEEEVEAMNKRVDANDAHSIYMLGSFHYYGYLGMLQDREIVEELWTKAARLGSSRAHFGLGGIYEKRGDMKRAKFHYESAAMAGHEVARFSLGHMEGENGNVDQVVKHWTIAASGGCYDAMRELREGFEEGHVSRDAIDSILIAYNSSCAEMRSEARDTCIQVMIETICSTNNT